MNKKRLTPLRVRIDLALKGIEALQEYVKTLKVDDETAQLSKIKHLYHSDVEEALKDAQKKVELALKNYYAARDVLNESKKTLRTWEIRHQEYKKAQGFEEKDPPAKMGL